MKLTPLDRIHIDLGAQMVEFVGWHMPIVYTSMIEEHNATRTKAGLFDLFHMARTSAKGENAYKFVQKIATASAKGLPDGGCRYSWMCNENGGCIDDIIIYCRHKPDDYFIVINGANRFKDVAHMGAVAADMGVEFADLSEEMAMIAIQGPEAEGILQTMTDIQLADIGYYKFDEGKVNGVDMIVSRTGYTGEDGFEVYFDQAKTPEIWSAMMEAGSPKGITPVGLGARDTLRLEAGMPLYGNEMDETINPFEADLAFAVRMKKKDFIGKAALAKIREKGLSRKLVGFETDTKRVPRHGYKFFAGGEEVGYVTSGTHSPYFGKSLGMGYLPISMAEMGTEFEVDIRGKRHGAKVVSKIHYKREQ